MKVSTRALYSEALLVTEVPDAIFPVLPRWFTAPLHAMGSTRTDDPPPSPMTAIEEPLPHDHVLLETLFYSTFEKKFISTKPSCMSPSCFPRIYTYGLHPPQLYFQDTFRLSSHRSGRHLC